MMGPVAAASGEIPRALLVEAIGQTTAWRPDTGAAKVGDMAIRVGQSPPEAGWTTIENGVFYSRLLTAADLTTTFGAAGPYYQPTFVVLRNVRSIAMRTRTSVELNTIVAGFPRDVSHVGLMIGSVAEPIYLAEPTVFVGTVPVAGTVRYYSPPDQGNAAENLHCFLAASYPEYQNNQTFKGTTGSSAKSAFFCVMELLGG